MSTEWTEETIRPHMFTEVEVRDRNDDSPWRKAKLRGFLSLDKTDHVFVIGTGHGCKYMRIIPKPTKRLMKPIELAGKWLDFVYDGMSLICGFDEDCVMTSHDSFNIEELNCNAHGCQGWRDTPTSELNTSFEVDE